MRSVSDPKDEAAPKPMDQAETSARPIAQPRGRAKADDCPETILIDASRRGEEWAMEALYHRYKRRVYALCNRMVGQNDADEVAQEAFVRIFRGLSKFRGESALSTWVYRLTTNAALTFLSRAPRRTEGDEALSDVAADALPERDPNLSARLEAALQQLPAGYRAVLVLHDIQGLSHEECAEILECRVGTSKSQLHKARSRMRELLGPHFAREDR
jgi:RNA polymerase sigma-70 factor (ECF subfamily)